jgi:2-polyprenyl-3-methyl-5-hydroxy-6-metoxy-1,4-benzoquinol methylase
MQLNTSNRALDPKRYARVANVQAIFRQDYPYMTGVIPKLYDDFGDRWADRFETALAKMFSDPDNLEKALSGYVNFIFEVLRLHRRFEVEGAYVNKSYEQAAQEVYHNQEYMMEQYLPGTLFSHFFWPHHIRHNIFFETMFLEDMRRQDAANFAEVGIGTGFYSRTVLENLPQVRGTGYDISENSKRYTEKQVGDFGAMDRYEVVLRDVINNPPENVADWLISVEVLEHLEDPVAFMRGLRAMLRDGGKAFITAALNAPNPDHIYLYRTGEEVLEQLQEAGFELEQYQYLSAHRPPAKGVPVPQVAAFIMI